MAAERENKCIGHRTKEPKHTLTALAPFAQCSLGVRPCLGEGATNTTQQGR